MYYTSLITHYRIELICYHFKTAPSIPSYIIYSTYKAYCYFIVKSCICQFLEIGLYLYLKVRHTKKKFTCPGAFFDKNQNALH